MAEFDLLTEKNEEQQLEIELKDKLVKAENKLETLQMVESIITTFAIMKMYEYRGGNNLGSTFLI